jgi:hypothetical protein
MNWWNERDSNPHLPLARRGLSQIELSSHQGRRPPSLKLRRAAFAIKVGHASRSAGGAKAGAWGRFRAHLSAFSARRFHQISFPGELVRTAGIEPTPPEWRSGTLPLSHVRMVRPRGFEPLVGRPACFARRRFYRPVAGKGRQLQKPIEITAAVWPPPGRRGASIATVFVVKRTIEVTLIRRL